jgi:predicted DNA-binding transcriptional regulator AlpA
MQRLLVVEEVLDLLRISRSSLDRLVRQARREGGTGTFPLPVQQGTKKKLLWHMADIERWANYRPVTSVTNVAAVVSPAKQRQAAKAFQQRQETVQQVLARHGYNPNK